MRISADKKDNGFIRHYMFAKVFLDGKEVKSCLTADNTEGWCLIVVFKDDGSVLMKEVNSFKGFPQRFDKVTEILKGEVKIKIEKWYYRKLKSNGCHNTVTTNPNRMI